MSRHPEISRLPVACSLIVLRRTAPAYQVSWNRPQTPLAPRDAAGKKALLTFHCVATVFSLFRLGVVLCCYTALSVPQEYGEHRRRATRNADSNKPHVSSLLALGYTRSPKPLSGPSIFGIGRSKYSASFASDWLQQTGSHPITQPHYAHPYTVAHCSITTVLITFAWLSNKLLLFSQGDTQK